MEQRSFQLISEKRCYTMRWLSKGFILLYEDTYGPCVVIALKKERERYAAFVRQCSVILDSANIFTKTSHYARHTIIAYTVP